jgi:stage II sporulation protein P
MRIRRIKSRMKFKIYPILWSGIIVVSIYLLIRFAVLSFSGDVGQADLSLKDAVVTKLCANAMESGSSVISYTADDVEETEFFPTVMNGFAIKNFLKNDSLPTANAKEYTALMNNFNLGLSDYQTNDAKEDPVDSQQTGEELVQEDSSGTSQLIENQSNDQLVLEDSSETQETIGVSNMQGGLGYYSIEEGSLSLEYILTNGAVYSSAFVGESENDSESAEQYPDQLQVGYLEGDVYLQENEDTTTEEQNEDTAEVLNPNISTQFTMEQLQDIDFLVRNFYIVDKSTKVTDKLFNAEKLLSKDMTLKQDNKDPQILIYHTHSQEGYVDSRAGKEADTVVGVGSVLAKILKEEYGYNVIHDKTYYDKKDRDAAYSVAEDGLAKILKENPTIEVVIDLHRDEGASRTTMIDGKETAQIMLFNGLSRNQDGPITYLDNPNLQDNLAFSLQMRMKSLDMYPGMFIKTYLKCYRYNMHVRPKCLLVELGTVNNTVASAKNAMPPFAEILDAVLKGK